MIGFAMAADVIAAIVAGHLHRFLSSR